MAEWRETTLGSLTLNFDARRIPVKSSDRTPGPYPYYGASGIVDHVDGFIFDGDYLLISEDGENLRSRATPIAFWATGKFWVNNHAHIVRGNENSDARFLGHLLNITDLTPYLSGSAQPKLSRSAMDSIVLRVPPIREQRAIAEVLGALDDKIAANARMHEIADELATALWRRISSMSETSHLTYAQVAEIGGGGTPSTREPSFWGGNVRWASPTDITALDAPYLDRTSKGLTAEGLAACSSALYPARSVLMTSRATIGSFAMAMEPTAVNQGFIVARAREPLGTWWLFHEMRSRVADYVSHANGATFLELPRGRFKGLEVRWPGDEALTKFDAQAQPLHARAYSAMVENRKLAELRDALLPELMSGRLRVKDAEKSVEEVV